MRAIKYIILHCTATRQDAKVHSITNYWKNVLGWNNPGYHYIYEADGTEHNLQPIESPSNGVKGHNHHSIHLSYIGGIDGNGKALDNRTAAQKEAMECRIFELLTKFPTAKLAGHNNFSSKACPSFKVADYAQTIGVPKERVF